MAIKKAGGEALNELKDQIKSNNLKPVYLFYGEEDYLKQRYLEMIYKKVVQPEFAEFNHMVFEGKSIAVDKLLDAVESYPVMAEKKLIVARDLDITSLKSNDKAVMEDVLKALNESVCLIFFYETVEFKEDKGKILELIKSNGLIVNFAFQSKDQLSSWAKKHFESLKKSIEPQALSYLIDICGPSMNNLSMEIGKICSYTKAAAVTLKDVEEIAVPSLEATIFELTDALASRSYDKAYQVMEKLLTARVEPIVILPSIAKTIGDMYKIKVAQQSGMSSDRVASDFKINPYVVKKLSGPAQKMDAPLLRQWIYCCADTDLKLKSSALDKRIIMESLIGSMISRDISGKGVKQA